MISCSRLKESMMAFAAVALFLFGCGRAKLEPLRIGINSWPGYEFLYLAQVKGFFAEEGVETKILEFGSLSDARRAFERGQLDGFATTVIEVLQARDSSERLPQIVQVVDFSDGADVVIARSPIDTLSALKGKRVGVELASLGVYMLERALSSAGLNLADVVPVSSDQITMEKHFDEGSLDAIVTYPPTSVRLAREGKGRVVFSSADIPGEIADVIAIDAEVIAQRPQDVRRVSRAFYRAVEYAQDHPADAFAIMGNREGITADEFKEALAEGIHMVTHGNRRTSLDPGG